MFGSSWRLQPVSFTLLNFINFFLLTNYMFIQTMQDYPVLPVSFTALIRKKILGGGETPM